MPKTFDNWHSFASLSVANARAFGSVISLPRQAARPQPLGLPNLSRLGAEIVGELLANQMRPTVTRQLYTAFGLEGNPDFTQSV